MRGVGYTAPSRVSRTFREQEAGLVLQVAAVFTDDTVMQGTLLMSDCPR